MKKHYKDIVIKPLPKSEIELTGAIDAHYVDECFDRATIEMSKNAELPGFRKGKVPVEMFIERIGEFAILEEAAQLALDSEYPKIVTEEKINFLGRPRIQITKLAKGNDLGFTITTAVSPEFTLPDYKKIAKSFLKEKEDDAVTEKDVSDVLDEMRKHQAHARLHDTGEEHNHENPDIKEDMLPALDDEFAKSMGNFGDLPDLIVKIKENLRDEKVRRNTEKTRTSIMEAIIDSTQIDTPEILVQSEIEKMLLEFKGDVERAGLTFADYLKTAGKSEDEIRKDWVGVAEKKAKSHLVINKIAEDEKIYPNAEKVRSEAEKILIMYKDSDPVRARAYVAMILTNEKVFEFFESLGEKKETTEAE